MTQIYIYYKLVSLLKSFKNRNGKLKIIYKFYSARLNKKIKNNQKNYRQEIITK